MHQISKQLDFESFFDSLESKLSCKWEEIFQSSKLIKVIKSGEISRTLYVIYMIETFHYTQHNARNQALVGTRKDVSAVYAKFCYSHAADEVGHEKMALHDVRSIGLNCAEKEIPEPLLETQILIAYLYWISCTGNPLQRLGYSYWAENCYKYINPVIEQLKQTLRLEASQLTFFLAHSDIDKDHFEDVKNTIRRTCRTQADMEAIIGVMETTLQLTASIFNGVYVEYENLMQGNSSKYAFLLNT